LSLFLFKFTYNKSNPIIDFIFLISVEQLVHLPYSTSANTPLYHTFDKFNLNLALGELSFQLPSLISLPVISEIEIVKSLMAKKAK